MGDNTDSIKKIKNVITANMDVDLEVNAGKS
jgi:hypothetical protein